MGARPKVWGAADGVRRERPDLLRVVVYVPRALHARLRGALRRDGQSVSWWFRARAAEYVRGKK